MWNDFEKCKNFIKDYYRKKSPNCTLCEKVFETDADGNYVYDEQGNVSLRDMTAEEKAEQRALLQYKRPENYALVHKALVKAGRTDLIGFGKECLIRPKNNTTNKNGGTHYGNNNRRKSTGGGNKSKLKRKSK